MSVQTAIVLVMLIVMAALNVRDKLRARCLGLGKCAGCPYTSECAAKSAAEQHSAT